MDWITYVLIAVIVLLLFLCLSGFLTNNDRLTGLGFVVRSIRTELGEFDRDSRSRLQEWKLEMEKELKAIQDTLEVQKKWQQQSFLANSHNTRLIQSLIRMQRRTLLPASKRR